MMMNKKRWLKKNLPALIACVGLLGYQTPTFADSNSHNQATVVEGDENKEVKYGGGDEETRDFVTGNRVEVDGDIQAVFGGVAADGKVENNVVEINGGEHVGATGGLSVVNNEIKNYSGEVSGNKVIIHGGTIQFVTGGEVAYTYVDGSDNAPTDDVWRFGGSDVFDNHVEIYGGTITNQIIGGAALSGSARNNKIMINGGTINGSVIGGLSRTGSAIDNRIDISGGTFSGSIIGGLVEDPNDQSEISGNSITIRLSDEDRANSAPVFNDVVLIGGLVKDTGGKIFGNKLTLDGVSNLNVRSISGFDELDFTLPTTGDVILNVTGGKSTELNGTTIDVSARGDNARVDTGLKLRLIQNDSNLVLSNIQPPKALQKGHSDKYELFIETDAGETIAAFTKNDLATSADIDAAGNFVTTGLHMRVGEKIGGLPDNVSDGNHDNPNRIAEDVITNNNKDWKPHEDEFREIEDDNENVGNEMTIFTGSNGSSLRTKLSNGGHINNKILGLGLGGTKTLVSKQNGSHLSFAPLIDYGKGKFDTYTASGAHGTGDTRFVAGGFIARRMLTNGFYYEGSFRYGRAQSSYSSNDFEPLDGDTYAEYDLSAPIFAGHVNIGKVFAINRENTVHVYGQYLHSHQGSMSTNLSSGEHYDFDSVDDGTFELGVRFINQPNKVNKFYSGFAYRYDHSSGSSAMHDGRTTDEVDSNGSSGMFELGWEIKPHEAIPWVVDLGAIGWIGQQKGLTFHAKVKKSF